MRGKKESGTYNIFEVMNLLDDSRYALLKNTLINPDELDISIYLDDRSFDEIGNRVIEDRFNHDYRTICGYPVFKVISYNNIPLLDIVIRVKL